MRKHFQSNILLRAHQLTTADEVEFSPALVAIIQHFVYFRFRAILH